MTKKQKLRSVWRGMIQRCYNPKNPSYKYYGARGVGINGRWRRSFKTFYNWAIKHGYKIETLPNGMNKWTIDRINPYGGYEPSNCRWTTIQEQAKNKRIKMFNSLLDDHYDPTKVQIAHDNGLPKTYDQAYPLSKKDIKQMILNKATNDNPISRVVICDGTGTHILTV